MTQRQVGGTIGMSGPFITLLIDRAQGIPANWPFFVVQFALSVMLLWGVLFPILDLLNKHEKK